MLSKLEVTNKSISIKKYRLLSKLKSFCPYWRNSRANTVQECGRYQKERMSLVRSRLMRASDSSRDMPLIMSLCGCHKQVACDEKSANIATYAAIHLNSYVVALGTVYGDMP